MSSHPLAHLLLDNAIFPPQGVLHILTSDEEVRHTIIDTCICTVNCGVWSHAKTIRTSI